MSDGDDLLIYHLYADRGVECEYLSGFGKVVRVGIDANANKYSEAITADATNPPLKPGADVVVCHPPCYKWAEATQHIHNRKQKYDNLIPDARSVAADLGEDYIIENVPRAPLQDPVVLNGRMFNMPIRYERAFETTFPVPQPSENGKRSDEVSWWNEYSRPLPWWKTTKGYHGSYAKDALVKTAVPKQYLDYLFQFYFADKYNFDLGSGYSDVEMNKHQSSLSTWD